MYYNLLTETEKKTAEYNQQIQMLEENIKNLKKELSS